MRKLINSITAKVSSLFGTARIKDIYEEITRIRYVNENILIDDFLDKNLFRNERYVNSKRITQFHKSIFTQNGEDGIIEEIFRRIGTTNKYFVEFGVHGVKNNSTFLLVKDWSGLWIGGSEEGKRSASLRFKSLIDRGKLTYASNWITKDNIEQLFTANNVPKELDLLSVDLDGNDYWVWDAIHNYSPRVVCVEYNATFPPDVSWVMTYNPSHTWDQSSYFGASLLAVQKLGQKKGYELVGCDFAGCNAFFVRADQSLDVFEKPFTAAHHYEPPRYFLKRSSGHKQGFGPFETGL